MEKFRREICWEPGYGHRNDSQKKQYGCHGLQIRWLLHGSRATVQFLIFTGWLPTWKSFGGKTPVNVLPADVGYHADQFGWCLRVVLPQYENQQQRDCEYRPGGECYYDGSGLQAEELFKILVCKGEEAVWSYLENYYHHLFTQEGKEGNES